MDHMGVPPDYLDPRIPVDAFKADLLPHNIIFSAPDEMQQAADQLGIPGASVNLDSVRPVTM